MPTSPSPPPTDGSGSSAITPLAPAVTPKDAFTSDVVWSVVEALQFMEDTNASQHDFQNMMKFGKHLYKRGMTITTPTLTESDYCQVRLGFI